MSSTIIGFYKDSREPETADNLNFSLLGDSKLDKHTCRELSRLFRQADQLEAMQFHIQRFDGTTVVFTATIDQEKSY